MSRRTNIFCCPTPLVADPNGLDGNGANVLRFDSITPNTSVHGVAYDGHIAGNGFANSDINTVNFFCAGVGAFGVNPIINSNSDMEVQANVPTSLPGVYTITCVTAGGSQIPTGLTLTLT